MNPKFYVIRSIFNEINNGFGRGFQKVVEHPAY